jgi:histidine triad (HIT) family protein
VESKCLFCKIIAGESSSRQVYSDDWVTAFHDIHPVAPVHLLIVPNKHLASLNDLTPQDESLIGHMVEVARQLANQLDVAQTGYRLIINTGPNAGQAVFHLHLHLIGGHRMRFPMG